jgi:hypothetical protein
MPIPKILRLRAQCFDKCVVAFIDAQSDTVREHRGYVPHDMCIGAGDDIELEIDVESGRILNWDYEEFSGGYEDLAFE